MKKSSFVFISIIVSVFSSLVLYTITKGFVSKKKLQNRDINISLKEVNSSKVDKKSFITKEEVTKLIVKPSKYILATEALDYEEAKKVSVEQNLSQLKNFKPLCKIEKSKYRVKTFDTSHPSIVIIMDDISSQKEIDELKSLDLNITPSIFPCTKTHKDTPAIASKLKYYMVHTPMQAFNYAHPEIGTLKVSDSLDEIDKAILAIHKDFPKLIAINNHTGSEFTSDLKAMDRLFCVLKKYKINFIDSKTAPHTLGKEMGKIYGMRVYNRDVFLDNIPDKNYILDQLKKAVKKAKKSGLCIAICHPRAKTFKALKSAKRILGKVKLIYANELY